MCEIGESYKQIRIIGNAHESSVKLNVSIFQAIWSLLLEE